MKKRIISALTALCTAVSYAAPLTANGEAAAPAEAGTQYASSAAASAGDGQEQLITGTMPVTTSPAVTTDTISEGSAVATVKIMDVSGDVILVKPVEGSWELKSADKFTLSAKQLPAGVKPAAGMKLEITYSGGILESYPAMFGNVQKVVVVKDTDTEKEDPTLLKGTKDMTIDDVRELANKGNDLDWSDFRDYNGKDVGSGLYIWEYKLENGYVLSVGGGDIQKKPDFILLSRNNEKGIDIRTEDIGQFFTAAAKAGTEYTFDMIKAMTADELRALYDEKGLTEEKGYSLWTAEKVGLALKNDRYFTVTLRPEPEFTASDGTVVINASGNYKYVLEGDDYSREQTDFLIDSLGLPQDNNIRISASNGRIRDGVNEQFKVRRYFVFRLDSSAEDMDTRNEFMAAALNYIRLSPYFDSLKLEYSQRVYGDDYQPSETSFDAVHKMTEAEIKALFEKNGMTEEKGYSVWNREKLSEALNEGTIAVILKPEQIFVGSDGSEFINGTNSSDEVGAMVNDNSGSEQFAYLMRTFDLKVGERSLVPNVTDFGACSYFMFLRSGESAQGGREYSRYMRVGFSGLPARGSYADGAMLTAFLNYVQLSPYFEGIELEKVQAPEIKGSVKGDANNDGAVDMADVVLIMQSVSNPDKYSISEQGRLNADIDGGGITAGDAQTVQKKLLGLVVEPDVIRDMLTEFMADQRIDMTVVPKDKMPEKFDDKYVFLNRKPSGIDTFGNYENFMWRNAIDSKPIRYIPYDISSDSELNKIREKLFCFMLENNFMLSIDRTDEAQDAENKTVLIQYDWNTPEEYIEKIRNFIAESDIDPGLVEIRQSTKE